MSTMLDSTTEDGKPKPKMEFLLTKSPQFDELMAKEQAEKAEKQAKAEAAKAEREANKEAAAEGGGEAAKA